MATDVAVLSALAQVTGFELRYFELVTLRFGGKQRRSYFCIGKHGFFLVKKDLSSLLPGGVLYYAYLDLVVVDTNSKSDLMLVLNDNRPVIEWQSPNLFVLSSKRVMLLQHLQTCWLCSYMTRFGMVAEFPKREAALSEGLGDGNGKGGGGGGKPGGGGSGVDSLVENDIVLPFARYKKQKFQNYSFFLREEYEERPSVLQATDTGHYAYKLSDQDSGGGKQKQTKSSASSSSPSKKRHRSRSSASQTSVEFEVIVHVHEPVELSLLSRQNREHVRWVALEYKQMLTAGTEQYYVLRNCSYLKKMNLSDDIAQWLGWQLLVKTEKHVLIVVVLRRAYVPPLMSSSQDVVVMFKSPNLEAEAIKRRKSEEAGGDSPSKKSSKKAWYTDDELLLEAQLIADSLSPIEEDFPVYRDVLQAKLDALRFDEDGYRFLENHIKLLPKLREVGKCFLKSVFQMLVADRMLANSEEMMSDANYALGHPEKDDKWRAIETRENPLTFAEDLVENGEGLSTAGSAGDSDPVPRNCWNKRVSRYLSYCLDGGLCRAFTLYDLIDSKAGLSADSQKKVGRIIDYLLHLRPVDMTRRYFDVSVVTQLQESLEGWEFNERVMQILLESDYIRKLFGRSREKEYSQCVGRLLQSPTLSITLKSSLCRQIVTNPPSPENQAILAPALCDVLRQSTSYYVQTCVCAALVVMSADSDQVKTLVMACGVAPLVIGMVTSRDDELVMHALMLTVNLSKHTHHRGIFVQYGMLPILVDILSSSYHSVRFKGKILIQLCAVIGQFCNDEDSRKILTNFPHDFSLDCLMFVFDECVPRSALECKVLYCMRMCANHSNDKKYRVGQHCHLKLLETLQDTPDLSACLDYVYNALCFLLVVAEKVENAVALQAANVAELLQRVMDDLYDVNNIQAKTKALVELIRNQCHREQF